MTNSRPGQPRPLPMNTLEKPRPTHREQHPVRECRSCGCFLRSYNESTQCSPCGVPAWEIVEPEDLFGAMAEAPAARNHGVDILQRIWELTPA